VFRGDLVARGPTEPGVLDLVAELGASTVQGNHEWRLLVARAARARGEPGRRLGPSHELLMKVLEDRHWAALEAMPYWVDLSAHELRVVHAGVVPGIPIERQDPWVLTHLRTLDDDGTPSDKRGATLWGERYREDAARGVRAQRGRRAAAPRARDGIGHGVRLRQRAERAGARCGRACPRRRNGAT
jgi:hypothetical protein